MYSALIAFFLVSIVFSFLCSLWEAVLLSISPAYMQIQLNEGGKTGALLKRFKDNIEQPLAAILTLNTIAHTVGAIGVGQEATKIWADTHPIMTGIVVPVLMTISILMLSEIIPKTLGATNWKFFTPFTVRSLQFIITVLQPIIWCCEKVTNVIKREGDQSIFSRADFLAMAQIGSEEGHLDEVEANFIHNLLHFKRYKAREIMTPRTVLTTAVQDMSFRDFYDIQKELVFSRIPIRKSNESEEIIGYVLKDQVLEQLVDGNDDKTLQDALRDIIIVNEGYSIFQLFHDFIQKREHIALIVDNFGGTAGIVTMEDIVETLLGAEIVDETDQVVDMQDTARRKWKNRYKTLQRKNEN